MLRTPKLVSLVAACLFAGCSKSEPESAPATKGSQSSQPETVGSRNLKVSDLLGDPDCRAICYGGYRGKTREETPTIDELKEDLRILSALHIRFLRTYNTQQFDHAADLLEAIRQMKDADPGFEMYVMLGVWIECEGARGEAPDHTRGHVANNTAEIEAAVRLANEYPDIVKVVAVGNEAMVHWAATYFVQPKIILKWVDHLKGLRDGEKFPAETWITSSDNFASWGGGPDDYKNDDLTALIRAVDYVSLHTYPFHDSHYNPAYWGAPEAEEDLTEMQKAEAAMLRAKDYAVSQYQSVVDYIAGLGIEKAVHIGETGWASVDNVFYGEGGSGAADEIKAKLYHQHLREWTDGAGITCFYFEAFDERWKDAENELGSENHFGLFTPAGEAKFALWELVDERRFEGLTRNGSPVTKTHGGDEAAVMATLLPVPSKREE